MVVFKSRKLKKLKEQRKNKTMRTKYKHRRYTLKQAKHKAYRTLQQWYNVNNKLGGAIDDDVNFLEESLIALEVIGSTLSADEYDDNEMTELLSDFFYYYENIETYEAKLRIIYDFNLWFIADYSKNPIGYKYWFKYIIERIKSDEIDYTTNYDTTLDSDSGLMPLLLLDEINKSITMIDSAA